jgi:hypothetical protein
MYTFATQTQAHLAQDYAYAKTNTFCYLCARARVRDVEVKTESELIAGCKLQSIHFLAAFVSLENFCPPRGACSNLIRYVLLELSGNRRFFLHVRNIHDTLEIAREVLILALLLRTTQSACGHARHT